MSTSEHRSVDGRDVEIVTLSPGLLLEASALLADYQHPDGWTETQREECEQALGRLLSYGLACFLVARRGETALGFACLTWGFSTTKGRPILTVQDLFTRPAYRRSGVARALLRRAVAIARERDAHRLQLNTETNNGAARTLYSSLGFEWFPHKEIYMLFV